MNSLKNLIQRCHKRYEKPLRQKKTRVSPAIYKGLFDHFTVFCARRYPVNLYDLEQADISLMPIGLAHQHDHLPHSFGGERFLTRQNWKDWGMRLWHTSWGIQVYTGIPSQRGDAHWHDLEFSYQAICDVPDDVLTCIQVLCKAVVNPLLVITKSGGLRFSCRVPDYLHPNTEADRFYVYTDTQISQNDFQRNVYLKVLGDTGHSTWDARYEIVTGDLLNPPIISKEILFAATDVLREKLHHPNTSAPKVSFPDTQKVHVFSFSFGSRKLDLAKEAFLKRGYTYIKQNGDYHYWRTQQGDEYMLLWEQDRTVWIRATSPNLGIPTEDTLITDVWDDTGILPPLPETGMPVNEKILAIRESKLSPLAIKRPAPVLEKIDATQKNYEMLDESIQQIQRIFTSDARIIALSGETQAMNNYELEKYILNAGPVVFSSGFWAIEAMIQHYQKHKLPSITRWRNVSYLWDQIKEIPADVRMKTPFQHGNVCEDPERFLALSKKGMNATKILCPQCPVYTDCQKTGFLSQPKSLQQANTQLFGNERIFLDPNSATMLEKILDPINDREPLCIINEVNIRGVFECCGISKHQLETWFTDWKGKALGNFAQALRNALETKPEPDDLLVNRIRTVMHAFDPYEQEITEQMCRVIHKGRVIEQGFIDKQSGDELARYKVEFEGGATAYIPLENNTAEKLNTAQLPVVQLNNFRVNEDLNIPLSIEQAHRLGILNITTVEHIQKLSSVNPNPEWTLWHQLKRFFAHYKRDTDAPIVLHTDVLEFWIPPVIHPEVKRLLLMSAVQNNTDFNRTFPDEDIEVIRITPTPWIEGNTVFQIRTGIHSIRTMLDYDKTWDVNGFSKMGERILIGICAEIDRDPNVKHAIITYYGAIEQLQDVAEKENVCLLTEFKKLNNLEAAFEAADVVWIVGTPYTEPTVFWLHAQMLYGNDEEPLCYEAEATFQYYKDPRIQRIYIQHITELLTRIVGLAGLNRLPNKKVVLISSLEIPDITDRHQTILFDWEDFEIAGSIGKLAETIKTRQQYEKDRENITAETSRIEIERILGCSPRIANSLLQQLRGGNIPRVTYREQILALLADGEKQAAEVIAAIEGTPKGIYNELDRLSKIGEITKVRRGVYALPEQRS